ncbi:hypothetical protein OKA04_07380 [Luteolibacter flavescens]|uniref:DUF1592 domain-containing protein n=1 Tax=Luteolibacter flavescens TaxID=1859460 RepID=A0ABT3FMH3_9BACT|nr:hypothetical protein [Luteolibacter flavescens]MCW1884549.1 hypothetical protein [Luteolibacter flavescens]
MVAARAVSLSLLSCAVLCGQEEVPPPLPPLPPPTAIPVDEAEAVAPAEADQPVPVVPGGNVPRPKGMEAAISQSGMFRVLGKDPLKRSSIALALEQVREQFLDLLREKSTPAAGAEGRRGQFVDPGAKDTDSFKVPVTVEIVEPDQDKPSAARPVEYGLVSAEGQLSLIIRIHADPGIDQEQLERAAFTVLLYERSLRTAKPEDDEPLVVRPWLVEGLVEARKWKMGQADRRLYEGVFRRGGGFTMDELFELGDRSFQQLDSASRLTFRALSGALVMALLEQPQGKDAFKNFAGEAARFSGEMPVLLRKHFPDLNLSERSLAKWWALTLARLVQPKLSEVLPVLETERELETALQFHTRDPEGNALDLGLDTWREIIALEEADRIEAVRPAEDGLVRLSYRCFPSYRPIIQEYQQILRDVAAGKDSKVETRLADLSEQRLVRSQRATHARDYLDFFEISRARDLSGEFDDYMRLKKELELRPRPKRTDHLSEVLDTLQKTYEPRAGKR